MLVGGVDHRNGVEGASGPVSARGENSAVLTNQNAQAETQLIVSNPLLLALVAVGQLFAHPGAPSTS